MGFPSGVAEQMVHTSFKKFPMRGIDSMKHQNQHQSQQQKQPSKKSTAANTYNNSKSNGSNNTNNSLKDNNIDHSQTGLSNSSLTATIATATSMSAPVLTENGKQKPIGNGGIGPTYYWTQTLAELTVYAEVSSSFRSKDIKCNISPRKLQLKVNEEIIIDGELEDVINTSESMWTISTDNTTLGPQIVINIEKLKKTWWKHVIVGHPEIDTSKVILSFVFFIMKLWRPIFIYSISAG